MKAKKEILTLQGHSEFISSIMFSGDGKLLAAGDGAKKIKLWDV
jgi:WD40 repeat protein